MNLKAIIKNLDVIAIIIASIGAIVLHHLGIIPESYVISLLLLLVALHVLQEALRGEEIKEMSGQRLKRAAAAIKCRSRYGVRLKRA